jgi:CRISPR-associated protein Cas5d
MKKGEKMAQGIKLRVWGAYAAFNRPELKVERYSYDVITPSAARGILESILWHPGLKWIIDKIYVVNPIKFISIRRNEITEKLSANSALSCLNGSKKRLSISRSEKIVQRNSTILTDVEYVIEAHFEMTDAASPSDSEAKFISMVKRRAKKGQCYKTPYLGCREFPAYFELVEDEDEIHSYYENEENYDLGLMLYDMDYSDKENITPIFFRANMQNGVLDLRNKELIR